MSEVLTVSEHAKGYTINFNVVFNSGHWNRRKFFITNADMMC